MKKIFLLLFCLPTFTIAQQTVGLFLNDISSYNGYTLINSNGSKNTYLIDNCGVKVYEWNSNFNPGLSIYLLNDGNLLRTNRLNSSTIGGGGSGGRIELLDPYSNVIWSFTLNTDSTLQHHDVGVLPNGNVLILAWELIRAQEADSYGSTISADRYSEMILEYNPFSNQIVWEWHAWDHLVQDTDSTLPNYGIISDNPNRININYNINNLSNNPDWIHANSIDYNEELDQIIINCAAFDEFWILDHSTTTIQAKANTGGYSGKGGDILYRWGNPNAYNLGDTLGKTFEFQHDAHWIPLGLPDEGKIMIFNNGQQRGYSSIDIINPPLETNHFNNYSLNNNGTYNPQSLFWSYSDSANFYSPKISGAQQLPNGNTLICSGNQGRIFEVEHHNDSVVWDYIIPLNSSGPITQETPASGNNIFRAHRFSPSYSGFNNLVLTPSAVIELNPLPSNCQISISGCTDNLACNYDPLANINDNNCTYNTNSYDTLMICFGENITVGSNTYSQTGTYTDSLTSVSGCDSTITSNLTIYSDIVSIISQSGNDITTNTIGGTSPYSYQWNTSETTQEITPLSTGDYWVIISDINTCESDSVFFTVNWISTSIEELNINKLSIYPNPSNDVFNIVFSSNTKQDIDLRIYNIIGEEIFTETLTEFSGDYNRMVDMTPYPNAIYILQLNTKEGMLNRKLVLENK